MTARFDIKPTALEGVVVLTKRPIADSRGFLERLYCADELSPVLGQRTVVQINRTLTKLQHTVRGLHFQRPPHAELKVVSCLRGSVFDVAVDLRARSPTYLKWHAEVLSAEKGNALVIPEGFAHGFQTLEPMCEMLYFHTAHYAREAEGGINFLDPAVAIQWPADVSETSERDSALPQLDRTFKGLDP